MRLSMSPAPTWAPDRVLLRHLAVLCAVSCALLAWCAPASATTPPSVGEEWVASVTGTSAMLSASVNPRGSATTYRFEYGTSAAYTESVPALEGQAGAGASPVTVQAQPQDLLPGTVYHFHVVATGGGVTVDGPDAVFTTQPAGAALTLPDGRIWEQVSPVDKEGARIGANGVIEEPPLVQAAEGGEAIAYGATSALGSGAQGNDRLTQVISTRSDGEWSTVDIATPHRVESGPALPEYQIFSPDLSVGLVEPSGPSMPLSPEATEKTIYLRDDADGLYTPIVYPGDVPAGTKFEPSERELAVNGTATDIRFRGASPTLGAVVFSSPIPLIASLQGAGKGEDLYEWIAGRLYLASVLPDGEPAIAAGLGSSLGSYNSSPELGDTRHAVSADGAHVFWSDSAFHLYATDPATGASVQVDAAQGAPEPSVGAAEFQLASSDGTKVFFTDKEPLTASSSRGDLYEYDTETGALTDLTIDGKAGENTEMVGLATAGEDGSYVYFVARGVLASGGALSGGYNLYVAHESAGAWTTTFIATLSLGDSPDWGNKHEIAGNGTTSQAYPNLLRSEVSPDGRYFAFMSTQSLTGYDNRDAVSGTPDAEVYLYDARANLLVCASCNPTGARPVGTLSESLYFNTSGEVFGHEVGFDPGGEWGEATLAASLPAWSEWHQPRYLEDSGRLFFDGLDELVPQATNGVADVYEYEPQGVGSCARPGGCAALISGGGSAVESLFLDASASGDDAFFYTAERLVPQDADTAYDVYDAHVCSVAAPCTTVPAAPPPCTTADSCRAAPGPQPAIFGAPPSATFSGTGNLAASATQAATAQQPKSKPKKSKPKKSRHKLEKRRKPTRRGAKTTARQRRRSA
jgi:hypothetical protein